MAARRIAIVGGGLAGLTCARALQERGEEPVIFDKGRRAGGRISSRRGEDGVTFDHGAMWLDAGERYAARLLRAWTDASGDVARQGTRGFNALATRVLHAAGVDGARACGVVLADGTRAPMLHQAAARALFHPLTPLKRALAIHPTGTGKSFVMINVLDNYFYDARDKIFADVMAHGAARLERLGPNGKGSEGKGSPRRRQGAARRASRCGARRRAGQSGAASAA